MTENEGTIMLAIDGQIATVTISREPKLNALTPAMLETLARIAGEIDADQVIRCVILTGAGEKAFCVGADINAWSAYNALDMWRLWVRLGHRVYDQWARLRVPVVAAINGHAFGGGLELAIVADVRVAASQATFALPEAKIATVPGGSGTQRLVSLIGTSQTKYLALTGTRIGANEALRIGLVHEISEGGAASALKRAREIAEGICAMAPVSVQLTKQIIDAGQGQGLAAALETMAGALAATTDDAREGLASFREKRPPKYRGK